jgi:hypothetical protein
MMAWLMSDNDVSSSGDLARIDENQTSTGITKKSVKAKKADAGSTVSSNAVEGVIYKVRTFINHTLHWCTWLT